jgi:coproporphyrinogen III oxidase-like Fe-S oxidoreductase
VRSVSAYLARLEAGESPQEGATEVLAAATARGEAIFLALRTCDGLDPARFRAEFGAGPEAWFDAPLRELVAAGLLAREPVTGMIALTARGRLLSDSVFERFV